MMVTLFGMVIDVKLEQPQNASLPIHVTLSGMVTDVKLEQPINAPLMVVTLFGIVTDVIAVS